MEERNELNDIILNRGGSGSSSKKLLLAIATLTLVLIIVLVIMSSLKNNDVQNVPQAILPPEPSAPTEIINDPLFEPVEVLQEGNQTAAEPTLDQVAQKIKSESLENTPVQNEPTSTVPAPEPVQKTIVKEAPKQAYIEPVVAKKPVQQKIQASSVKPEPKKVAQPKIVSKTNSVVKAPQAVAQTIKTSEVKTAKTPEVKTEVKTTPAPVLNSTNAYFVQVGSFTKEPNKDLIDRLNASGLKYTTQKAGETTKILVGPFQGEKAVQDAMGNIRQNIEAKAFKIKG